MFIYQQTDWPNFRWNHAEVARPLAAVRHRQGRLLGQMAGLGFPARAEAALQMLTLDVTKSSDIEGERLDAEQVRSSIARRLGLDVAGLVPADRYVEGVVEMMLDATQHYAQPLTTARLFGWQAALFPTGHSGMVRITVGGWRTADNGPMQVVSGPLGHERVHFQAPDAAVLNAEMTRFLDWFNASDALDPVLKAAVAHLWFVTLHPFDDGNGRIARAIADLQLARADESAQRFYSMSAQIRRERSVYYDQLERTQRGDLDITRWLLWFVACFDRALTATDDLLGAILRKARYWEWLAPKPLNARQRQVLNRLLDGFEGHLTTSKWAKLTKASQDTALRDIQQLLEQGVLQKAASGGRSTHYVLSPLP